MRSRSTCDEKAWAANLDYHRRQIPRSLESFRRVRAENYELLKELPEAAFERTGTHSERGSISLGQLLQIYHFIVFSTLGTNISTVTGAISLAVLGVDEPDGPVVRQAVVERTTKASRDTRGTCLFYCLHVC